MCRQANIRTSLYTYLEARHIVEPGKFFNVSRLGVEACSMPWATDTTITKVTIDQRSSIVGALVTNSAKLSVLTNQKCFGVTNVDFLHPVREQ